MPKSSQKRRRTERALIVKIKPEESKIGKGSVMSVGKIDVSRSGYSVRQKGPETLSTAAKSKLRNEPNDGSVGVRGFAPDSNTRVNRFNKSAGDARRPKASKKLEK